MREGWGFMVKGGCSGGAMCLGGGLNGGRGAKGQTLGD